MATPFGVLTTPFTGTVDGAVDTVPYWQVATAYSITRNKWLNIASQPVGLTDSQTLTNKTLTAPTISGPTLSGTVLGTYTLGGTPTFPASVVTLTGSQTLTNKTLTSPAITGGSLDNATVTVDTVAGHTTSNSGTIYGMSVTTGVLASAALLNTVNTAALQASAVTAPKVAPGFAVQAVSTNLTAVATGSTVIPYDDTIPQNTEGDQYMSQAITPNATTNRLSIEVTAMVSNSASSQTIALALFQDSTANALAATADFQATATASMCLKLTHDMAAGTISATTFKVRIGGVSAGTTTFNGNGGTRVFGGITISNIKITEYRA